MTIVVNGRAETVPDGYTIEKLLAARSQGKVAVAVNKTFVPASQCARRLLHEGDEIEIVSPMQGG